MSNDKRHLSITFFFLVAFVTIACNSINKEGNGHQVVFANFSPQVITYDTFNFNKTVNGSKVTFYYEHSTKGHRVVIDTITNKLWIINIKKDITVADYSRTLWTKDRETILKAYEYFLDRNSQDGETVLYVSPSLGLISDQSLTWKRGSCLKQYLNNEIDIHSLTYFLGLNYPRH